MLSDFLLSNTLFTIFLIAGLGYLLGGIKVKGISLGTAGILIVALVFGHFGIEVPGIVQNLGLACFVTAVGFIAGPNFFNNFKQNAKSYIIIGVIIIFIGVFTCYLVIKLCSVPKDLAAGLLVGALTSTPGLATAVEATQSDMVPIGYGIAYPFGVISVVMFVQLLPKLLYTNMEKEREQYIAVESSQSSKTTKSTFCCDKHGFFGYSMAIVFGILIGKIVIPLGSKLSFSLGISGGPLLAGLIFGHFGRIGKVNLSVKKETLSSMRELGLAMFLIGAGTHAGSGFIRILQEQGAILFMYGAIMALLPMIIGFIVARKVLKLSIFNSLGAICGGMTSTPALGTLIKITETDDVASAYASTYPVALAAIVILVQLMVDLIV